MNPLLSWGVAIATLAIAVDVHASDATQEPTRIRNDAHAAVATMSGHAERIRAQLRRARSASDATQAACLDGALSRADVALRYGRDYARGVVIALDTSNVADARDQMTRLAWRLAASREAMKAAESCANADLQTIRVNGTVVRVVVDPPLPADVTDYPSR